jgi:hypothetical protein
VRLFLKRKNLIVWRPWSQPIDGVAFALFFLLIGLQTLSHSFAFSQEYRLFVPKTTEERINLFFDNSYRFAQYCHLHLPGKHWGQVVTDLDITKPQEMITFFAVAYYLYPIDIRIDRHHPKDCLVIFSKKDPLVGIPDNYQVAGNFDEHSLLAIPK